MKEGIHWNLFFFLLPPPHRSVTPHSPQEIACGHTSPAMRTRSRAKFVASSCVLRTWRTTWRNTAKGRTITVASATKVIIWQTSRIQTAFVGFDPNLERILALVWPLTLYYPGRGQFVWEHLVSVAVPCDSGVTENVRTLTNTRRFHLEGVWCVFSCLWARLSLSLQLCQSDPVSQFSAAETELLIWRSCLSVCWFNSGSPH